ncbi:hypothetical protein PPYR_01432 [Photinus pyralis]|uniref:CCHC-type domain-containing protein n=1 Tax=Photinus pyralis TaxID=7054 RepID=A0A5N4B4E3_PHOPY|nr:hypothetical protein PPYR_01432 [Photinus pyralis]
MATAKGDEKYNIEKLRGAENWPTWRWHVEMVLQAKCVLDIVEGKRVLPLPKDPEKPTETELAAERKWRGDDLVAATTIAGTLTSDVAQLVLTTRSSVVMWATLTNTFEHGDTQRVHTILTRFMTAVKRPEQSMAAYIASMKKDFFDLNHEFNRQATEDATAAGGNVSQAVKQQIPESILHYRILCSISDEYSVLKDIWKTRPRKEQTLVALSELLCSKEQELEAGGLAGSSAAFLTHKQFRHKGKSLDGSSKSSDKENEKSSGNGKKNRYSSYKCYKCNKMGHLAKQCRNKTSDKGKTNLSTELASSGAFIANMLVKGNADGWVCDSGASDHMTGSKHYFASYEAFQTPRMVGTAASDTLLYAVGTGNINVLMTVNGQQRTANDDDKFNSDTLSDNPLINEIVALIGRLYSMSSLPRSIVQLVVESVTEMMRSLSTYLKSIMEQLELTSQHVLAISNVFSDLLNVLEELGSEYLRFKYFTNLNTYIKPETFIIGEQPVFQGQIWRNLVQKYPNDKIILPLLIYFDDFECCNPLGSKAGVYKIGATYVSLACIPPELATLLENILVCCLFYSSDRTAFGNKKIFSKLMDELIFLETQGITINFNAKKINVYFTVVTVLGDNLGLNSILGFTESFQANNFCRICKSTKAESKTQFVEDPSQIRTEENYLQDVETLSAGIKEPCMWRTLPKFVQKKIISKMLKLFQLA